MIAGVRMSLDLIDLITDCGYINTSIACPALREKLEKYPISSMNLKKVKTFKLSCMIVQRGNDSATGQRTEASVRVSLLTSVVSRQVTHVRKNSLPVLEVLCVAKR